MADSFCDVVFERVRDGTPDMFGAPAMQLHTTLDPHRYVLHRSNYEVLKSFDCIYVAGSGLRFALKLAGLDIQRRLSFDMTSLGAHVLTWANDNHISTCLIGGKPGVSTEAASKIRQRFPKIVFSSTRPGFFSSPAERQQVLEEIARENPRLVIAGLGAPIQEVFLRDLRGLGWRGAGFTCGGFLHQTAEKLNYYPPWVERTGLRWLYRVINEPRIALRLARTYTKFLVVFFADFRAWRSKARHWPHPSKS